MRAILFCRLLINFLLINMACSEAKILGLSCIENGACVKCSPEEMGEEYCKETGRKISIECKYGRESTEIIADFKSCTVSAEDDQLRVIIFQVVIGVIGAGAFYVVQKRKHMTMYDSRTRRRNPGT